MSVRVEWAVMSALPLALIAAIGLARLSGMARWWMAAAFAGLLVATTVRSCCVSVVWDQEVIVVRNVLWTHRIPFAEVLGVKRFSPWWFALVRLTPSLLGIARTNGRRVAVSATLGFGYGNDALRQLLDLPEVG
jgi:hypothetical protein